MLWWWCTIDFVIFLICGKMDGLECNSKLLIIEPFYGGSHKKLIDSITGSEWKFCDDFCVNASLYLSVIFFLFF